jgi:hypothetical protein
MWCERNFKEYKINGAVETDYCPECRYKVLILRGGRLRPDLCMEFRCDIDDLGLNKEIKAKVKAIRNIILKDNIRRIDEGRPLSMPLHYVYELKKRITARDYARRRYSKKAEGTSIPQG